MTSYIEIACRWIFALQMIFWGLNGFFNWVKIPESATAINDFTQSCIKTRFIMPIVKIVEIMGGVFLIFSISTSLTLVIFAPIIFVITGLHILHNPRPWGILTTITLPYLLLLFFHGTTLLRLVH